MLNLIGFIILLIIVSSISFMFGGIPSIILMILTEMGGLGDYMWSLMWTIFSFVQLIVFLIYIKGDRVQFNFDFSLRAIVDFVTSIFSKNKKVEVIKFQKTKEKMPVLNKIELVIVIGVIIGSIFVTPHSAFLNLIYSNYILRVLYYLGFVLVIINLINQFREEYDESIFSVFSGYIVMLLAALYFAATASGTFLFFSGIGDYHYDEAIKSLYIYDNNAYDDKRKEATFKGEYEFLKEQIEQSLISLKATYDINDEVGYQHIISSLFDNTKLTTYGYGVTDRVFEDKYISLFRIVDRKTKQHRIYRLNYQTNVLEKASDDEFMKARANNA